MSFTGEQYQGKSKAYSFRHFPHAKCHWSLSFRVKSGCLVRIQTLWLGGETQSWKRPCKGPELPPLPFSERNRSPERKGDLPRGTHMVETELGIGRRAPRPSVSPGISLSSVRCQGLTVGKGRDEGEKTGPAEEPQALQTPPPSPPSSLCLLRFVVTKRKNRYTAANVDNITLH